VTVLARPDLRLASGVVALEFAAAVSTFVSATLLPTVAEALHARDHLGLMTRVMPAGTARLAPGMPAALAAMLLFATGWFGADGLITVLLTDGYGTSVARAAVVLSAAPLAWAVTSVAAPRRVAPAVGMAVAAGGVAVLASSSVFAVGLLAWAVAGAGTGLAYPGLYVRCTTSDRAAEAS
jgi:hypothetical protein